MTIRSESLMQATATTLDIGIMSDSRRSEFERRIIEVAQQLIAVPSPNPPLDNSEVALAAAKILKTYIPGSEITTHRAGDVTNLVARIKGVGEGRRLVFNGHLDTYPVGDTSKWTVNPYGGKLENGRLYGRGACDMKGGIAASICAMRFLTELKDLWAGELVLTLGGDEESMGNLGIRELLKEIPHATGDAAFIPDAGSPMVTRFGEKGFLWISVQATGSSGHGAHVHRGINAIDRLRQAMDVVTSLREERVVTPPLVDDAIRRSRNISERMSGVGESEVLTSVTVNIGRIEGGSSPNLIPASASFAADIRIPAGVSAAQLEQKLRNSVAMIEGVTLLVDRCTEPTFTEPTSEIVRIIQSSATHVLGKEPALNMRVGASDARIYREFGVPTVVYGPTPYNMGGADEYVMVDELVTIMQVQVLTALEFLKPEQR